MNNVIKTQLFTFYNSSIAFLLAFFIVYIPSQFFVFWVAYAFDIPAIFERFKLIFPILDHSYLWTQLSVTFIYLVTPLWATIVTLASRIMFYRYYLDNTFTQNLILIWLSAWGMHFIFGALVVGIPIVKDVGYIPDWLYFPDWLKYAILVFSIFILAINGVILRHQIETLMYDENQQQRPFYSLKFKSIVAIFPALFVLISFIILGFPTNNLFMQLFILLMIFQLFMIVPFKIIYVPLIYNARTIFFEYRYLIYLVLIVLLFIFWKIFHQKIFPIVRI